MNLMIPYQRTLILSARESMRHSLETCEWLLSEMDMGLPHQRV